MLPIQLILIIDEMKKHIYMKEVMDKASKHLEKNFIRTVEMGGRNYGTYVLKNGNEIILSCVNDNGIANMCMIDIPSRPNSLYLIY